MKTTGHDYERKGFRRQADLERKAGNRPITTRGRHLESGVDWHQLPMRSSNNLVASDGVFWFVPGYSKVGGPDRVRP